MAERYRLTERSSRHRSGSGCIQWGMMGKVWGSGFSGYGGTLVCQTDFRSISRKTAEKRRQPGQLETKSKRRLRPVFASRIPKGERPLVFSTALNRTG